MIKTKFSALIVCSILISGISHSYILGTDDINDEESSTGLINGEQGKETASKKSWRRICTLKNARLAFVALAALTASVVGYEYCKNEPSSTTPLLPLNHPPFNQSLLICPIVILLNNEKFECPVPAWDYSTYFEGARLAETVKYKKCLPYCTPTARHKHTYKSPKVFVCEERSPQLKALLYKMDEKNVRYEWSGTTFGSTEKPCSFYIYESTDGFDLPNKHFTVAEIEKDPQAMATIGHFFNLSIFHPSRNNDECNEWILAEGE